MLAVFFAVRCFVHIFSNNSVHIATDNVTTMFYINKRGGTQSSTMCHLALKLWNFCICHKIDIYATHVPGVCNVLADRYSRMPYDNHDYALKQDAFNSLLQLVPFTVNIDLFASRLTNKLPRFVSHRADPFAWKHDAFSFPWPHHVYLFPPIPLLARAISKFIKDEVCNGLVITPAWPSLPTFPVLAKSLISDPILIPSSCLEGQLPLRHRFHLLAWPISSATAALQDYRKLRETRCSPALLPPACRVTRDTGKNLLNGFRTMGIVPVSLFQ